METNFYTNENLEALTKEQKKNRITLLFLALVFIITFVLVFVLSTYENQLILQIVGSAICGIFSIFIVITIFKLQIIRRKTNQFNFIQNHEGEKVVGIITKMDNDVITLADSTKAKEIVILAENKSKIIYLEDSFDYDFQRDHQYRFVIVSDYIKEVEDED